MKSGIFWKWNLGISLVLLPMLGRCLAEAPTPKAVEPSSTVLTEVSTDATNASKTIESKAESAASTNDIASAPVQLISAEKPLPAGIRPTSPAAEIIKLANSGVDEGVMMAYVTNSPGTFNLAAADIIYLKDIGVPDRVVTAMIQRDQELRLQPGTAIAAATPWLPPGNNPPPPLAEEVAPQMDPAVAPYPAEPPPSETEVVDDSSFYSGLSPYGNWVNVSGYGTCWQPTAAVGNPGWQPYYNCGRWVWTDCGWYWMSDYSWGWAPFHYGRWFRHDHLGWCWAPDHVWGPSWVSWRYTDNYCGWAPLPPGTGFVVGVGLSFHGHHVNHWDDCGLGPNHYQFVAWHHFRDHDLHNNHLPHDQNARLFHDSVVATRISGHGQRVVNDGLSPERVAAATHVSVRTTELRDSGAVSRPPGRSERFDASGKTLTVYRPRLPNSAPSADRSPSAGSAQRAPSSLSAASAQSALGSQPAPSTLSAPSAPVATGLPPANRDRASHTLNRAQPDDPRLATANPRAGQNAPLILHGAQNSASHEAVPPNSLVVIGRKNGAQTGTAARPAQPAWSVHNSDEGREPLAWNNNATPWVQNPNRQPAADRWRQSSAPATGSSQPVFVPRSTTTGGSSERTAPVYRPAPTYQAPVRTAPPEVPRYAPAPANNNNAPRVSSPPPAAAPARQAPSAPAQPGRGR